ncbi:MAG: sialidase family protein [Gemmatimonadaceae bacterium]
MCLVSADIKASPQRQGARADSVIMVGEDRPVDINARNLSVVEPHLATDRSDVNHLLAGAILVSNMDDPRDPKFVSRSVCAALSSFDGGKTWSRHDSPHRGCGDPWVVVLPDGRALFVGLVGSELVAFRSTDGGKTWNDKPVSFGRAHDHGTAGIDATSGRFGGSAYVVSHQTTRDTAGISRDAVFVARSSDGGATFGEPIRIIASNLPTYADGPVTLSDGALVVPFLNFNRKSATERSDLVWTLLSSNGGRTFSVPRYVGDCSGNWGQLAVDESTGPFQDRLYWVCWTTPIATSSCPVRWIVAKAGQIP